MQRYPENTVTRVATNLITTVMPLMFSLPTTFSLAQGAHHFANVPIQPCPMFQTKGLAAGMVSLSRARLLLPTQIVTMFRFSR